MPTVPDTETVPAHNVAEVVELSNALFSALFFHRGRPIQVDYQPGNGTRYELVIQELEHSLTIQRSDNYPKVCGGADRFNGQTGLLITLLNFRRSAVLSRESAPEYIAEKLCIGLADAHAISFLLRDHTRG